MKEGCGIEEPPRGGWGLAVVRPERVACRIIGDDLPLTAHALLKLIADGAEILLRHRAGAK